MVYIDGYIDGWSFLIESFNFFLIKHKSSFATEQIFFKSRNKLILQMNI